MYTSRTAVVAATIVVSGCLVAMGALSPVVSATPAATRPTPAPAAAARALAGQSCASYPGSAPHSRPTTVCSAEVPSFDGSPLDADVTMPMPGTGPDHPLMVMLHGFGNNKHEWESTSEAADNADKYDWNSYWFAEHGYYVLTYTARGFKDSGATGSYEPPTPAGTAPNCLPPGGSACPPFGTIRVKNKDVEIRDTQWLAALTAQVFRDVNRNEVAVTGGSYGGGESWLQAAQQAGRPAWADFPGLPQLRLQVAVPKYPWTDLAYSLAPNGHPGGPAEAPGAGPYRGIDLYSSSQGAQDTLGVGNPFGVGKLSYVAGLYSLGTTSGVFDEGSPVPQSDGPEPFTPWLTRVSAGEPYDTPGRTDDPVIAQIRTDFSGWHSAYYQPDWAVGRAAGREPAVYSVSGWTDDLFPPVESFRMFNYLKSLDPRWPVAVTVADVGHARAQNPPAVWQAINAQAWTFVKDNIAGSHRQATFVSSFPTVCAGSAAPADEISGPSPAGLAKGQLTVAYRGSAILTAASGAGDPNSAATDAIAAGAGCHTSPGPVPGGYTAVSQPLTAQQTFVGIGFAQASYQAVGAPAQPTAAVAERVWDVKPDGGAVLVSRGVYRFDFNGYDGAEGTVRVPLYGNHWIFPQGDRVRLDLEQVDSPTYRAPNGPFTSTLDLSGIRLILPVREQTHTTVGA